MKFIVFLTALLMPTLSFAHGYHFADYVSVFGVHLHPEHILALGVVALVAVAVSSRVAVSKSKNKRR